MKCMRANFAKSKWYPLSNLSILVLCPLNRMLELVLKFSCHNNNVKSSMLDFRSILIWYENGWKRWNIIMLGSHSFVVWFYWKRARAQDGDRSYHCMLSAIFTRIKNLIYNVLIYYFELFWATLEPAYHMLKSYKIILTCTELICLPVLLEY